MSPLAHRPRILIAGAESGCGKTSIACALIAALRGQGLRVQAFKAGPDYLDPTYLARASGRPCYNLDGWMMGEAYVRELFMHASADADISIIEGAMGLFDGFAPDSSEGSAAELARWLDAPVLLVANAHGMARSFAAVAKGFDQLEPGTRIAGVIANRCGSDRHAELLQQAIESTDGPRFFGGVEEKAFPSFSSRHLGLVTAGAANLTDDTLQKLAHAATRYVRIAGLLELAHAAPPIMKKSSSQPKDEVPACLAVAYDEAFHFYYQDFLDALAARNCRIALFSPLRDEALPEEAQAVYIGGGYPEEYAALLSGNTAMREAIQAFAASGRMLYAECGGLMYLTQGIEQPDGSRYPMAGLLPVWSIMHPRLRMLGYADATLTRPACWGVAGATVRGHEFHYSSLERSPIGIDGWSAAYALRNKRDAAEAIPEGYCKGSVLASYVHLHLASCPEALTHFLRTIQGAL